MLIPLSRSTNAWVRFSLVGRIIQAASERCNLTLFRICLVIIGSHRDAAPAFKRQVTNAFMGQTNTPAAISPPVVALDLGDKRVGVAICDTLLISITRLRALPRSNWKQLLRDVKDLIRHYDAQTVVIGLPLRLDGSDGDAALDVRRVAQNFARSLEIPVYLQDERLTSVAAEQNLRVQGFNRMEVSAQVDSEAAALILGDFLGPDQTRMRVSAPKVIL